MKFKTLANGAAAVLFAVTNPIVIPARAIGMFDPKRKGATAIEYGLIAAGVAVAIIAVLNGINQRSHDNSSNPPAVQQQSK